MTGELVGGEVWCMWAAAPQEKRGLRRLQGVAVKQRLCQKTKGVVELFSMQYGRGEAPVSVAVRSAPYKTLIRLINYMS